MNKDMGASQGAFLETKEYRRFAEFCDACRQQRYIGLCHGFPGVGKTLSAWQYAKWHLIQPYFPERFYVAYRPTAIERVIAETIAINLVPLPPEIGKCQSILYTPPVANTPKRVEQEIQALRLALSDLVDTVQYGVGCLKVASSAQFSCPGFGPRSSPTPQYLGQLMGFSA